MRFNFKGAPQHLNEAAIRQALSAMAERLDTPKELPIEVSYLPGRAGSEMANFLPEWTGEDLTGGRISFADHPSLRGRELEAASHEAFHGGHAASAGRTAFESEAGAGVPYLKQMIEEYAHPAGRLMEHELQRPEEPMLPFDWWDLVNYGRGEFRQKAASYLDGWDGRGIRELEALHPPARPELWDQPTQMQFPRDFTLPLAMAEGHRRAALEKALAEGRF